MPPRSTLGLALIARDEEKTLPRLLASIRGAFDQVVLLDTGSKDRTIDIFEEWARHEHLPLGYKLDHFEWCDDFAAARNAADDLLETDWLCSADADDWLEGAEHLRQAVGVVPDRIKGFGCMYRQILRGNHSNGSVKLDASRLRLRRRGYLRWAGRLHEDLARFEDGYFLHINPNDVRWFTDRSSARKSSLVRNAQILRSWANDEPYNPIPLRMLSAQELVTGSFTAGVESLRRYRSLLMAEEPDNLCINAQLALYALHVQGPGTLHELMQISAWTAKDRSRWLTDHKTVPLWGCCANYLFFGRGLPHEGPAGGAAAWGFLNYTPLTPRNSERKALK